MLNKVEKEKNQKGAYLKEVYCNIALNQLNISLIVNSVHNRNVEL